MSKRFVKCKKCLYPNNLNAKFCKNCGHELEKLEKEKIYKTTIYYKIELFKEWYEHFTLSTITSHIFFRVCVIGLILGYGCANLFYKGNNLKIEENSNYEIVYNEDTHDYYLVVDENVDKVPVQLYIPKSTLELNILHYQEDGVLLESSKYVEDEPLYLTTYDEDYFILNSKTKREESIKVYLYNKDKIDLEGVK